MEELWAAFAEEACAHRAKSSRSRARDRSAVEATHGRKLASLLWPDNDETGGRTALRKALGFLTAESPEMRWGLVALTAAIAVTVLVWLLRETKRTDILPLAMVLGGALGNIFDRVAYGYVVDYADLHFGEFRPFLIFNLADAAITVGVLLILARSFLSREKRADNQAGAPATESEHA